MPLPAFVEIDVPRPERVRVVELGYAWHPLLAFAAEERNTPRLKALRDINEWLKTDPDLSINVPIKERSLEIFGNEKRLDQLRAGGDRLFDGKLTLAALACRVCPIPLPFESGPATACGRPILILENNDSWASFCVWNRTAGSFSAVAYAGGGHAKGLAYDETFLDELLSLHQATELVYFGDLDPAGLRIAAGAARRRAGRGGSPLMPGTRLYAWLLAHGRRTKLESSESLLPADLEWLPADLRSQAVELFAAGLRVPQESLGTRELKDGVIEP